MFPISDSGADFKVTPEISNRKKLLRYFGWKVKTKYLPSEESQMKNETSTKQSDAAQVVVWALRQGPQQETRSLINQSGSGVTVRLLVPFPVQKPAKSPSRSVSGMHS